MNRVFRGRRSLSSAFMVSLLLVGLFIPLLILGRLAFVQAGQIYGQLEAHVRSIFDSSGPALPSSIKHLPVVEWLSLEEVSWNEMVQGALNSSSEVITGVINRTSATAFDFIATIFLTVFTMFYFFRDGEALKARLLKLSPLRPQYESQVMERFHLIACATIKGTVVVGMTQGALGTIVMLLLGFEAWLLWGCIMIVLSIIPIVGSYFVLVPAALYLFATGRVWSGIIALVAATVLNYGVDYVMRPALVGHGSKVHDLIIFFSTLGGLAVFGVMGFVVGPVIAVLFLTFLDMYATEFKDQLDEANKGATDTSQRLVASSTTAED